MTDNDAKSHLFCGLHEALYSGDIVLRNFGLMSMAAVGMALLFILMCPLGPLALGGTPACTVFAVAVCVLLHQGTPFSASITKPKVVIRILLIVMLTALPGIYFGGSNQVARFRYELYGDDMLWDSTFLSMDTALLGLLFPKGQIALFLDQNTFIGPTTFIGKVYAEVLQIMYGSYYFWGNSMAVYLLLQYFLACQKSDTSRPGETQSLKLEEERMTHDQHWRRLMMFSTAWTGTYLLNFVMNLMFPAVSPRIYIAEEYQNEISGLFFANLIRSALKGAAANSYSAFPSGHCGLSWLPAYMAHRFGFTRYAYFAKIGAVLITSATIILRYHYFVDMLFATILFSFGVFVGNLYSQDVYEKNVLGRGYSNAINLVL